VETFKAVTSFSWAFGLLYLLFVIAAVIFPFNNQVALGIALFALNAFYLESNTFPFITKILPKRESRNIIADVPARSKAIRQVVIMAHYDSSRSALSFSPQMVKGFRRSYLLMVGSMVLITLAYAAGVWSGLSPDLFWYISLPPALYLFFAVLLLVHREVKGVYTPGGNDNASGLSVLLEVGNVLTHLPLLTTSVTLLATGAEESGTNGALDFIKKHRPPQNTYFINLDNLGIGKVSVITKEGILGMKPSAPELISAAKAVAQEKGLDVDFRPYNLLTTDATVTLMRKYPTMGIMAFDEDGLLPNWHWPTDRAEFVQPENLETAKELVLGVLRKLES
ncbi:MAG TPA: M20/M25/M40 family metallo-hydrolase, partial [Bacillota bacterium]